MSKAGRAAPQHSLARTLAAVFGAPCLALIAGTAMVRYLPGGEDWAVAVGLHAIIPSAVTAACVLPLARSGARAWLLCAVVVLPLAATLWLGVPR